MHVDGVPWQSVVSPWLVRGQSVVSPWIGHRLILDSGL